ncbi:MAG: peptidoglycan DD-metalloendopeptidase family protein [Moraxellaceae bacterium]|nr:peptidoglycan DD-metalloendopeptidase family protein [Moraxellaceae bacterium]
MRLQRLAMLCLLLLLGACAGKKPPVVEDRRSPVAGAQEHVVAPGETLYAIALRYDKDYRDLAALNGLNTTTYLIRPGQRLKLSGQLPPRPAAAPVPAKESAKESAKDAAKGGGKEVAKPIPGATEKSPRPAVPAAVVKTTPPVSAGATASLSPTTAPARASSGLAWAWPVKGPLLARFGSPGLPGKGVDIGGKRGDSVLAAADGTVVYAGTGLVGYGRLIIVRHDDNYISAYAHNDRFLVAEGERVKLGQPIAQLGATGTDREKLHFEIREGGKPVDPLRFLPNRE